MRPERKGRVQTRLGSPLNGHLGPPVVRETLQAGALVVEELMIQADYRH